MPTLDWIGKRIRQDVLGDKRAEYGKQIVYQVGRQLAFEYGDGFGRANLFHMVRFYLRVYRA